MARIITLGSLNLDFTYQLPKPLEVGETLSSLSYRCGAGGKGANQSIAAARAGAEVYHAGRIGHDGALLRRTLADSGVKLDFLEEVETPTGHAVVLINDAGDNSIVLYGGANRTIDETFIDRVTSAANPGDILLLQNEVTCISHAMEAGRKAGMRVAFNFAPFDPKLAPELPLSLCDVLFLNRIEAGGIAGKSDVEETLETLSRRFPETELVLTLGPEGAVALTPAGEQFHADSPRVEVVETTAAGDTFIGYYLAAVLDGFDTGRALERACRAAALCCSRAGAAESIPTRAELDR
ncbi:ribokinase [uncultured Victivallis sp.]|uniref:ribokinase n=1 Tax=uncultured Victivallis sp. TaxID=354118 RepID=UPI0025EFC34B|nr:ribokinase [uncultured Victivallis sp.]